MPNSMWEESMRIGFPEFDEARKHMVEIIEKLDIDPCHSLKNEFFLIRFRVMEAAVLALFEQEELLMTKWGVPDDKKNPHIAEHSIILSALADVYIASMNNGKENALEVYVRFKNTLRGHITNIEYSLRNYVPASQSN